MPNIYYVFFHLHIGPFLSFFYFIPSILYSFNIIHSHGFSFKRTAHFKIIRPLSFVQPFWQVVRFIDNKGRGIVGKKPLTLLDLLVVEVTKNID